MSSNQTSSVNPAKNTATASPGIGSTGIFTQSVTTAVLKNGIPNAVKVLTQQYIELQREYTRRTDELNQIRENRRVAEQKLITAISQSGLSGYGITYQGNKLTLGQDTSYETLTYKFLEECLAKLYGGDVDKSRKVVAFIKKQRVQQTTPIIKIGGPAASRSRPNTPTKIGEGEKNYPRLSNDKYINM